MPSPGGRLNRASGRRGWSFALALILVLPTLLAACGSTPAASAPVGRESVWEAITGQIQDGTVSKDTALEAFAYSYGVDIPGVNVPAGAAGGAPQSGTPALLWVWRHWSDLTAEQRRIVGLYSVPQPADRVIHNPSAMAPGGRGMSISAPRSGPGTATELAYQIEVLDDLSRIGPRLGLPVIRLNQLTFSEFNLRDIVASTWPCAVDNIASDHPPCIDDDDYGTCNITVWKNTWSANPAVTPLLHEVLTHEVIHCYQNLIWGDMLTASRIPPWISEGSALWLASDDTKAEETMVASQWTKGWFGRPERDLSGRTYDSFGWFALLDLLGRKLWTGIVPAWRAAQAYSIAPSSPFIAALQGDNDDVRLAWAPSLRNNDRWVAPWITHGFGLPAGSTAREDEELRADIAGYDKAMYGRNASLHVVIKASDEIVIVQTDGLAAVHETTDSGAGFAGFTSMRFCVKGDCICPATTKRAGERMTDEPLVMPFVVALHGGPQSWNYRIASLNLLEECQLKPTPAPTTSATPVPSASAGATPPCQTGCGTSNGDPHLRTLDRHAYDFQAAGEFTLIATPDRLLEVQVRQERYHTAQVAINTAVAVRAGGHRIAAYMTDAGLAFRIDGVATTVARAIDFGGGARVQAYASGLEVDAPDGSRIFLVSRAPFGINVLIQPSEALRTSAVGLLGTVLPGGLAVPALPDGTRLPQAPTAHDGYHLLYEVFAPAWRVRQTTTLFDYDAGRTTESYLIAGFPAEAAVRTSEDLTPTERATGLQACAGVTDPNLLVECMFDVSIPDLLAIADLYRRTNGFLVTGTQALDAPVTTATASSPPGPLPTGLVGLVPSLRGVSGARLGPDGTLYLSLAEAAERAEVLAVNPVAGTIGSRVSTPGSGRVAIAAGSLWVGVQPDGIACAILRLDPSTLATQATIPVPCSSLAADFAAADGSIWFVDRTTSDADGRGGMLRHLDPLTNTVDRSVQLPFVNGFLSASADTLYWRDDATYRLDSGGTALESLGTPGEMQFPAGSGVWTEVTGASGLVATFTTHAGAPDVTLPIEGFLVGADESSVYTEIPDVGDGTPVLWRFPADGSDPMRIAAATTLQTARGPVALRYAAGDPLLVAGGHVVKLWLIAAVTDVNTLQLIMQTSALP